MIIYGRSDLHTLVSVDKTYVPIRMQDAGQFWNETRVIPVFDMDEADVKRLSGFGLSPHIMGVPFTPDEIRKKEDYEKNATISAHAQNAAIAESLTQLLQQGKDREIEDLKRQLAEAKGGAVAAPGAPGKIATPQVRKAAPRAASTS